jgi:hypothetical protein
MSGGLNASPVALARAVDLLWEAFATGARPYDRHEMLRGIQVIGRLYVAAGSDGDTDRTKAAIRELREVAAAPADALLTMSHAGDRLAAVALLRAFALGNTRHPRVRPLRG